ncbi:KamA family radical SAM protein [Lacunimicrobium album]
MSETSIQLETVSWRRELARAIRDPAVLLSRLELPENLLGDAHKAAGDFSLMVTESFLSRMVEGDVNDPLLRQVLPTLAEMSGAESGSEITTDAVGDQAATRAPGLIHKYQGRALLIATGACAINCRYCFRRHYPYSDAPKSWTDWKPAFDVLRDDSSIEEIILSGGDPLMLPDGRFAELVEILEAIPHLKRLRIHSRLPIVLPSRVNESLLATLTSSRLQGMVVVHANHPNELDEETQGALKRLVSSGVPTLNQCVLLKGINDDVETLAGLCTKLVNVGVMPYYMSQLDRVAGVGHFEVPVEKGRQLIKELRTRLPGYAVPQYVQELPGEPNKLPL